MSSLLFLDTTKGRSLTVVSLENPLTTEGGAAKLAAPTVVTATSEVVVASHSSSVADLDAEGMNGSQKSQLEDGGGGGGGGGSAGEAVTEVQLSELVLSGGGGGGGRGDSGGGRGEGRRDGRWLRRLVSASANWRRAEPVLLRARR